MQLANDYVLLVFLGALGTVQVSAARSHLLGLLFLRPWPRASEVLGAALVIGAFVWFFSSGGSRNIPDTQGGLDGTDQAAFFSIGAGVAFAFTLLVSSVVNHAWGAQHGWDARVDRWPPSGLTWLERTTFARAVAARLKALIESRR